MNAWAADAVGGWIEMPYGAEAEMAEMTNELVELAAMAMEVEMSGQMQSQIQMPNGCTTTTELVLVAVIIPGL